MTLLSFQFVALALCAVVLLPLLRGGTRLVVMCALSGWFVASHLDGAGLVTAGAFIGAGWALARLALRRPRLATPGVVLLVGAFIWARRYSFLEAVVPGSALPDWSTLGLSFLLFKVIHVIVDAAGGRIDRLPAGEYLAYCLNFTTFLLGPIQRFDDFVEQWHGERASIEPGFEPALDSVLRVMQGLVKKYVLAEYVLPSALAAGGVEGLGAGEIVLATWAFYVYLYLDFSGYCDVVIGTGALMGVRPPENFRMPFLAPNVSEFWLRVHRSLTTWLTDYVFNPVFAVLLRTGSPGRRAIVCAAVALMVTMLVSGLWHGTTVNFLLFGLVHGVMLVVHRVFDHRLVKRMGRKRARELRARPIWRFGSVVLTFVCTATAYVFFVLPLSDLAVTARSLLP